MIKQSSTNILLHSNNLLHPIWEECHSIVRSLESNIDPPTGVETISSGKVISITDLVTTDFHLICQRFSNGSTLTKEFSIYVKKTEQNCTDFNIYAMYGLKIAAFRSKDWSYIDGCATEQSVQKLENGWVLISVKYNEPNNDIFIGCCLGLQSIYQGHNQKQFYLYLPQLKWEISYFDNIRNKLKNYQINALDIGASGGIQKQWLPVLDSINLYMVEPSHKAMQDLKALCAEYEGIKFLPYALGKKSGINELFITVGPGCSSLRQPNFNFLKFYPVRECFEIVKKESVDCYRYDELVYSGKAPVPHFVKIDVQGYEFEVLVGFGKLLHDVLAIELESHFYPIYESQKCIGSIVEYLHEYDFVLKKLEPHGPFEGDLIEVNAFFTKRKSQVDTLDKEKIELWEQIFNIPEGWKYRM